MTTDYGICCACPSLGSLGWIYSGPTHGKQGRNLKNRVDSGLTQKRVCNAFIRKQKQLVNVYVNASIFLLNLEGLSPNFSKILIAWGKELMNTSLSSSKASAILDYFIMCV